MKLTTKARILWNKNVSVFLKDSQENLCQFEKHISCPFCRKVSHFPQGHVDNLVTFTSNEKFKATILSRLTDLKNAIIICKNSLENKHKQLIETFDLEIQNMHKTHSKCNVSKVTGSSVAIAGGITTVVGAALMPFTLGASLIVSIIGASVSVAGGATAGGTAIVECVINKNIQIQLQQLTEDCHEKEKEIVTLSREIEDMEKVKKLQIPNFKKDLVSAALFTTAPVLRLGMGAADCTVDILTNVSKISITGSVGFGLRIASGILSGLIIPFDIYNMVCTSIDIHRKNPTEFIKELEKQRNKLDSQLKEFIKNVEKLINEMSSNEDRLSR